MSHKLTYREIFYKQYYQTQVGRLQEIDSANKLTLEKKQFTSEIVPLLPQNKSVKILDVGCGFGSLISALKDAGFSNCKGIDVSEEQVKIAHQLGFSEVEQADVFEYLSKHVNEFDVILAMDILEHFTKDEALQLLQLIKKSLKQNGLTLFRTPNADAPFASIYAHGDFTHELILNSSSARQLMLNAGFSKVEILSSEVKTTGIKSALQKLSWHILRLICKWMIFATARTTRGVVLTPNLIIKTAL